METKLLELEKSFIKKEKELDKKIEEVKKTNGSTNQRRNCEVI